MHEFSLCQGLFSALQQQPFYQGTKTLCRIEVSVGSLSGVEPELLRHAYSMLAKDTPFEGIELTIKPTQLTVECKNCQQRSEVKIHNQTCPHCGHDQTLLRQGDECALTHLFYGETSHV